MAKLVVLGNLGDALAKPQTQPTLHQNPGEKRCMNLGSKTEHWLGYGLWKLARGMVADKK